MPASVRRSTVTVAAAALVLSGLPIGSAIASPAPGVAPSSAAVAEASSPAAAADILDRIKAVPGVTSVTEATAPTGYRFFRISFTQYRDHKKPGAGTFQQRLSLLHKDDARPMVMYTSGYGLSSSAGRSEPTRIVDGNQLSMEYRFFHSSIPENANWPKELTIWQAATDQHRIIEAFKSIYDQNWITTGGSKGGMTATYHRRFYPDDVIGSVPYVAPNDVVDDKDVYNEFLATVGNDQGCRDALTAVQRRALGTDRAWFLEKLGALSAERGLTWDIVGSMEKAFESAVIDYYYAFWQYSLQSDCADVPDAATASRDEIWDHVDAVAGLTFYADPTLSGYTPYYYQAAYQMGSPEPYEDRLGDLLKFPGANTASTFVPASLKPIRHEKQAMRDIDRWVRTQSEQMLYIYGANDPWSAEPFTCGKARPEKRECYRFYVPGGNHGSNIAGLPEAQRNFATNLVLKFAGLSSADPAVKQVRTNGMWKTNAKLDKNEVLERGLNR